MPTPRLLPNHLEEANHSRLRRGEVIPLVVFLGKHTRRRRGCASRSEVSVWKRAKFDGESRASIACCAEVRCLLPRRSLSADTSRPWPRPGLITHPRLPPLWGATRPRPLDEDRTICRSDLLWNLRLHPPRLLDEVSGRRMPITIRRK